MMTLFNIAFDWSHVSKTVASQGSKLSVLHKDLHLGVASQLD